MKQLISVYFAVLILTSSPFQRELGWVQKVSAFALHYIEHLAQENIGIVEFITLHYQNPKHHQEDHETHQNLPFQDHAHFMSNILILNVLLYKSFEFSFHPKLLWIVHPEKNFYNSVPRMLSLSVSIWKPPRA